MPISINKNMRFARFCRKIGIAEFSLRYAFMIFKSYSLFSILFIEKSDSVNSEIEVRCRTEIGFFEDSVDDDFVSFDNLGGDFP